MCETQELEPAASFAGLFFKTYEEFQDGDSGALNGVLCGLHTREASPTRSEPASATEKPVPWGRPRPPSCPAPHLPRRDVDEALAAPARSLAGSPPGSLQEVGTAGTERPRRSAPRRSRHSVPPPGA